jgi:alpha-amylase
MNKLLLCLGVLIVTSLTTSFAPRAAHALQPAAAGELPWWNDRVFYEIFVRSFYDSDGDGVGDLRGIIEKLDYLNDGDPSTTDDLGITGIWLMPVQEATRYHGYDVDDYRAINNQYGTADDLRALIEAAHARGIVVIVDLVLNHTSYLHPWFQASLREESPYADWYVWRDSNPGYRGPDNQEVWHQYEDRFYYGVFWSGMPDLNLTNPDVTAELYDIARYWLVDLGVDGFRLDAVKHYIEEGEEQVNTQASIDWAAAFNRHVEEVKPGALTVGEIWSSSFDVARYIPDAVDLAFEFDLASAIVGGVQGRNASGVQSLTARAQELYPQGQYATFLSNHDQNRVMSDLRGDVPSAKVAASLLLLSPGVPFLYYGEEIGMMGVKPDERIRTPMQWTNDAITAGFTSADAPWEPLADEGIEFSVAAQTGDSSSLLSHYRALIHLRNEYPSLRRGTWTPITSANRRVYAFLRQYGDETLLVMINVDRRPTDDFALELPADLPGDLTAEALYGLPADALAQPARAADGSIAPYAPLATMPPHTTWVIKLG